MQKVASNSSGGTWKGMHLCALFRPWPAGLRRCCAVLCCTQCLADQFLPGGQATVKKHWMLITTLIVASAGAIGCYLPSIWGALALVGATTSTVQAFIIPGLVILSVERAAARGLAVAAAARADRRANGNTAFVTQGEMEQGLSTPLLAGAGDAGTDVSAGESIAGAAAGSTPRRSRHAVSRFESCPAAALAQPSFKVDRAPQPAWLCALRQAVAVFAIVVGVGLFANSVLEALWRYAHPHAEGIALIGVYRMLVAQS